MPVFSSRADGWMDDLRVYVLFKSISVISGQWLDDNERLCAMEPDFQSERFPPQAGLEYRTIKSVGQSFTELPELLAGGLL